MSDTYIDSYGWCKVTCRFCGEEFNVHPLSNALSDNNALCGFCAAMKMALIDQPEPIYISAKPAIRVKWSTVAIIGLIEFAVFYGLARLIWG
jgi:hypothetical protein